MSVSSGVQECACDAHAKSKHTVECSISCRGFCHQVANLDLPYDAATYMHRVGRTGRFGTHGTAIAFVTPAELQQLRGFLQDVAGGQVRPETNIHGPICVALLLCLGPVLPDPRCACNADRAATSCHSRGAACQSGAIAQCAS